MSETCPRCGCPLDVSEHGGTVEAECPKCHLAEYAGTLERAAELMAAGEVDKV